MPEGEDFYLPLESAPDTLLQGDVYLCPCSALVSIVGRDVPPGIPPVPQENDIGSSFLMRAWEAIDGADDQLAAPPVAHEVRWGPVMVVSHECDLQKDFNALGRLLERAQGLSRQDIEDQLGGRTDLDRYAVVAPVLSYTEIQMQWPAELRTDHRLGDVRRGTRMDYFPLPAHPLGVLPESAVSFVRMATVERQLLQESVRVASLTEPARSVLRYKLGSSMAIRDASVITEIEAAVGQRIVRTSVTPIPQKKGQKKSVAISLFLEHGEVIQLQGAPIRDDAPDGPSRPLRS